MTASRHIRSTLLLLIALPLLVFFVKKVLDWRNLAASTPAHILIDTSQIVSTNPSLLWRNLAQGGEENIDMISPVTVPIRSLQPDLIRIDHVFDFYDVYQGPGQFNFSRLDQVINTILSTGATPLLSLSYTPASMTADGQNASAPADWNNWYQLVRATVDRYSQQKNIPGIYYEVWNEPDLFGSWHYGKHPSYSTLYINTAKAVAVGAGKINYFIGGPATTAFYPNWMEALFKVASANDLRLDFISWHKYSTDIGSYLNEIEKLNAIISRYPQYFNVQRLITETGPFSDPHAAYDNNLSAVHLFSLVGHLQGRIHRLFTFEIIDGPTPRSDKSTGWGIITHATNGNQPKPRYYALQFLNQLSGPSLAVSGFNNRVSAIATQNNATTQVLVSNFDPSGHHQELVPVTFKAVNPGEYTLKTTRFLGSTTFKRITIPSYMYTEQLLLPSNSAFLLELTPTSSSP